MPEINLNDFDYELPEDRIAQYPAEVRDSSRLVIWKNHTISEKRFRNLPGFLPSKALLVSNETKVIHSRILFKKDTGAVIEVFLLDPADLENDIQKAFATRKSVNWKCLVGNSKKWKEGSLKLSFSKGFLLAERVSKASEYSVIRFSWKPENISFSEVVELSGMVPLPPYMKRKAMDIDNNRYQTIYAKTDGSVAAPTAGLHFTDRVFTELKNKQISLDTVTLHVGAGTFKPIAANHISEHVMHAESIVIQKKTIEHLLAHKQQGREIMAVGTTTTRTLESLYWLGVQVINNEISKGSFYIPQWYPYAKRNFILPGPVEAMKAVLEFMNKNQVKKISGQTRLMIVPGYTFQMIDILITNFHLPGSTLLLLVSAFIGEDWKNVYDYALNHNFRFLSYGDACLFFKLNEK